MNELPAGNETKPPHELPFDDYPEATTGWRKRTLTRPGRITVILRALSATLFILALSSAAIIVVLDFIHIFQPALLDWKLKSAYPLIFIGSSYLLLQFTLLRGFTNFFLSLAVSIAFILWGTEQFLSNPMLISFIDDVVVLLFVLDLSIVIRAYLKRTIDTLK